LTLPVAIDCLLQTSFFYSHDRTPQKKGEE
jgi:hypothetical protein